MRLIAGSSNQVLAQSLSHHLNIPLVESELSEFANGERRVWIKERLDGQDVVILQSFSAPVDTNLMELLLMVDALERLGAKDVHVIIPWYGYSLQDKVFRDGEPIAAKVVANLVSHSYVKRVYLVDLHNTSITGFFNVPTTHISAMPLFIELAKNCCKQKDLVIASPDFGGLKRARQFATQLAAPLVNIDKHRDLRTGLVSAVGLHGEVAGKTVVVYDDIIVAGSTVTESAEILKKEGAKAVHFYATHGLFVGNAAQKLQGSKVDSVVVTNTILKENLPDKIKTINIGPILASTLEEWL